MEEVKRATFLNATGDKALKVIPTKCILTMITDILRDILSRGGTSQAGMTETKYSGPVLSVKGLKSGKRTASAVKLPPARYLGALPSLYVHPEAAPLRKLLGSRFKTQTHW